MELAPEHLDPGVVLDSWCRWYLAKDRLPDRPGDGEVRLPRQAQEGRAALDPVRRGTHGGLSNVSRLRRRRDRHHWLADPGRMAPRAGEVGRRHPLWQARGLRRSCASPAPSRLGTASADGRTWTTCVRCGVRANRGQRHDRGRLRQAAACAAIWMRLPHVSSKTAVVTGPIGVGGCVNWTPRPAEPIELGLGVVDGERRVRDAVLHQRLLERLRGRVGIGLEEQLDAIGRVGRDDGQPSGSRRGRYRSSSRSRGRRCRRRAPWPGRRPGRW